jgi:catechol 2,3-dioxygenase-like lactoylglutathione lyase family enzyme
LESGRPDELFVSTPGSEVAQGQLTGRHHVAFHAASREMVDAFDKAALAAGGSDGPGERSCHPGSRCLRARSRR